MKILFVCKSLPPRVAGGIQTHTWKLSGWLHKLGHEVSILCAGSVRLGEQSSQREGRHIIEIPYLPGRKLPFLADFVEEWAFNRAASQWLRRHAAEFDVVHVQGRSGFTFPGRQSQTPLVATFHGLLSLENRHKNAHGFAHWLHGKWAGFFEKNTLRRADACIAVSPEMRDEMEAVLPGAASRTHIIPNGVDVPKHLPQPDPTDPNLLLFVGRLCRLKGLFPLVEAMQKVPQHVHLVMIGDGEERHALGQAIVEAGLHDRVLFTGSLPSEEVFEWLHRAWALVLPSFHETQGIVLLEANACGKPVVASDLPGTRSVVQQGENGLLVQPGDVAHLAAAIRQVFADPDLARQMGRKGRQIATENFSWEKIALETERLYGSLLAEKFGVKQLVGEAAIPHK